MLARFSGHKKRGHILDEQHYDSTVTHVLKPIMATAASDVAGVLQKGQQWISPRFMINARHCAAVQRFLTSGSLCG